VSVQKEKLFQRDSPTIASASTRTRLRSTSCSSSSFLTVASRAALPCVPQPSAYCHRCGAALVPATTAACNVSCHFRSFSSSSSSSATATAAVAAVVAVAVVAAYAKATTYCSSSSPLCCLICSSQRVIMNGLAFTKKIIVFFN